MPRLILMTQREFADPLARLFRDAVPDAGLTFAWSLPDLEASVAAAPQARVVSVGGAFIVPRRMLQSFATPAYNFHPGPPNYPGIFPSVFALYEGATEFGVTLHEMAPAVDSGPIVAVSRFPVTAQCDRLILDTKAFIQMMEMLQRFAAQLADTSRPLPYCGEVWSGHRRTRKDFEAMCCLPGDFTAMEFERRYRAVGEGPDHSLTVQRGDQTFRLETGRRGDIVRAGIPLAV